MHIIKKFVFDLNSMNVIYAIIGNVKINPGDYILGDIDGVVCIPVSVVDEVIKQASIVKEKEDIVRQKLNNGENIRTLFEKYRVF